MGRNGFINSIISVILVAAIAATGFFAGVMVERVSENGEYTEHSYRLLKINNLIEENYYFRDKIDKEMAFKNSFIGYVASLGDPFSYYLDESDLQDFSEDTEGEYVGIGVEITVGKDNFITVIATFSGSAASEAGIEAGDKLIKVAGEEVTGDMLSEVVSMIKGRENEEVDLQIIKPGGEVRDITVLRRKAIRESIVVKTINSNLGYIKISTFDGHTTEEFENKFAELDLAMLKGLIVDLRSNSGGLLNSVVEVSDYFMGEGDIVKIKYTSGEETSYKSDAENKVELPIAVLINGGTASAAELMAGALKDNNGAVLIGENTFGKGVVGKPFPVDRKTSVVLTIAEYFLPAGKNIHGVGIPPDFEVKLLTLDTPLSLLTEAEDLQLQKAIEVLSQ